tara:strand:- start:158 stop:676 length:519 start_codon:yes stop_codon:yes gene_type:complete
MPVVDTTLIKGLLGSPVLAFKDVITPHGESVVMAEGNKKTMSEKQIDPNTAQNKLNADTVMCMEYAVSRYTKVIPESLNAPYGDGVLSTVYILSMAKEYKYGHGAELIAIADGGKNQWDKPVKYVRFFAHYAATDKMPSGTLKPNDKTYTFSHEKAKEMWESKIKEGYKRVQ